MTQIAGQQSIKFDKSAHIISAASIVGKKEGEGPLGKLFDLVGEEASFGENTWEEAESTLQREACQLALGKAKLLPTQMRYVFCGDLLGQLIASSFGVMNFNIPMFGLYGACSTCGESLSLGAMAVSADYADYVMAVTSSHFGSAEKQFRFPLEYGNQRPLAATWTVTGSGAFILAKKGGHARITGITTGKIVDYGVKDSLNMGACMAPAACDTIYQNLMDFNRQPDDYDKIITGDLGYVGQTILIDLLKEKALISAVCIWTVVLKFMTERHRILIPVEADADVQQSLWRLKYSLMWKREPGKGCYSYQPVHCCHLPVLTKVRVYRE